MTHHSVRLHLTAEDAMWMWRILDVMADMANTASVWASPAIDEANRNLGEIAMQFRDELSAQGVSGDPVEEKA